MYRREYLSAGVLIPFYRRCHLESLSQQGIIVVRSKHLLRIKHREPTIHDVVVKQHSNNSKRKAPWIERACSTVDDSNQDTEIELEKKTSKTTTYGPERKELV